MISHKLYPRGSIYLSGGMQFADDLGAGWREKCSERLQAMKYFPIDIARMDKEYTKQYGQLYFIADKQNHLQYKSNFRRHFIHADVQLVINDSDALIVLYDESVRRGAGTTSEVHEAYKNDIPVFLVSSYPDWQNEVPGWMQAETTKVFTDFESLYEYLDALPFGILKRDIYGNHGVKSQYLCSLCGDVFNKTKQHFVSKISPTYCGDCVDLITKTHEGHEDRYQFILEVLEKESIEELNQVQLELVDRQMKHMRELGRRRVVDNAILDQHPDWAALDPADISDLEYFTNKVIT